MEKEENKKWKKIHMFKEEYG